MSLSLSDTPLEYKSMVQVKEIFRYSIIAACIAYILQLNNIVSLQHILSINVYTYYSDWSTQLNTVWTTHSKLYATTTSNEVEYSRLLITPVVSLPSAHVCSGRSDSWLQSTEWVGVGGQTYQPFNNTAIRIDNNDDIHALQINNIAIRFHSGLTYDIVCNYDDVWKLQQQGRSINALQRVILTHNGNLHNIVLPCTLSDKLNISDYQSVIQLTYHDTSNLVQATYVNYYHSVTPPQCAAQTDWIQVPYIHTRPVNSAPFVSNYELKIKPSQPGTELTDDDLARLNTRLPITPPVFNTLGELIDERIELRKIKNFFNASICQQLIEYATPQFVPSRVVSNTTKPNSGNTHSGRTSTSAYIKRAATPLIQWIEQYAADLVHGHVGHVEGIQVVRYTKEQQFKSHYDWFQTPYVKQIHNQRQYTFFVYLNHEFQGGNTTFQNLNRTFKPEAGTALFWRNAQSLAQPYIAALHSGDPITNDGVKYGANIWYNYLEINHHMKPQHVNNQTTTNAN